MDEMLNLHEAARALRVSRMTVYRLVSAGTLAASRVGKQLRIAPQQLENYIKNNQICMRSGDDK